MNSPDVAVPPARRPRWSIPVAAVVVVGAAVGITYAVMHDHHNSADAAMAARAQQVMPFDLNSTKHTFAQTPQGGVETVVVTDPTDTENLALIRSHLRMEAQNFRQGNYSDPAKIHGMNMPGMQELEQGASRVTVVYADVPGGAQVTYTSTEASLIAAIHDWFDRQASDHSTPGMGG